MPTPTPNNAPTSPQNGPGAAQNALVATTPHAGAVALPSALMARLAAQAKDEAAKERPAVSKISLRGGMISYGGSPVAGNVLPCVILAAIYRNTYYDKPFDPNNLANPTCFALSEDDNTMFAHENVPDDMLPGKVRECDKCPLMEWGSDPKGGRGKACKETRRLVVMPANAMDSVENVLKAELAILDIPVTSVKNYGHYVNTVAAQARMPVWAVTTEITTERDPKTQFKVLFNLKALPESEEILEALDRRKDEAVRLALTPYDEPTSTEEGKMAPPPPAGAKKAKF